MLVISPLSTISVKIFKHLPKDRISPVGMLCRSLQAFLPQYNRIGGVMVSVFASSLVDRGFEPRLGQTKDYKIGICCFFAKHAALRRKRKDWLAWNQDNVFWVELHVSPRAVVSVSYHYKNPTQRVGLE
jgi:hypothetical protein